MYPSQAEEPLAFIIEDLLKNGGPGQHLMDNRGFANIKAMIALPQFVELEATEHEVIQFATRNDTYIRLSENNWFIRWKNRNEQTFPLSVICYRMPHRNCNEIPHYLGFFAD